jgi:hypothetical protein
MDQAGPRTNLAREPEVEGSLSAVGSDRAAEAAVARVAELSALASAEEAASDAELRDLRDYFADDSPELARIPTRAVREIEGQARRSVQGRCCRLLSTSTTPLSPHPVWELSVWSILAVIQTDLGNECRVRRKTNENSTILVHRQPRKSPGRRGWS